MTAGAAHVMVTYRELVAITVVGAVGASVAYPVLIDTEVTEAVWLAPTPYLL